MQAFFQSIQSRLQGSPIAGWTFPSLGLAQQRYPHPIFGQLNAFLQHTTPVVDNTIHPSSEATLLQRCISSSSTSLTLTCHPTEQASVTCSMRSSTNTHSEHSIPISSMPTSHKKRPLGLGLGLPSAIRRSPQATPPTSCSRDSQPSAQEMATTNPRAGAGAPPRSKKGAAGLGLGLPSMAQAKPAARARSSSSATARSIAAAASQLQTRPRTVSPLNFLRPARFPKRPLYAIPEVPSSSAESDLDESSLAVDDYAPQLFSEAYHTDTRERSSLSSALARSARPSSKLLF
ncbi:hypothetical protein BD626DRAFT_30676 [Schizophyllum amplum]|uniref:Uncharacterized protein n=1 Tax=Schizophyllum amplum TaxID=97359 RepID=A0A550D0L1_9AGAR|nr:hypothetical protein BD626DRAFT_30676 [Auriculariopsis ampla]